ncbi:hypothetical protein DK853_38740, partial [Klebsiella oxytoca]
MPGTKVVFHAPAYNKDIKSQEVEGAGMANARRYNTATYEKKLGTVMTRLGIDKFDYDYTRRAAWVTFTYKGQE